MLQILYILHVCIRTRLEEPEPSCVSLKSDSSMPRFIFFTNGLHCDEQGWGTVPLYAFLLLWGWRRFLGDYSMSPVAYIDLQAKLCVTYCNLKGCHGNNNTQDFSTESSRGAQRFPMEWHHSIKHLTPYLRCVRARVHGHLHLDCETLWDGSHI